MTDFADAFNRGQQAAKQAAQARAEIDEVFEDACQQLLAATDGRLDLSRRPFPKEKAPRSVAELVGGGLFGALGLPQETELWIAARNPKAQESDWSKLAKWEPSPEGYPCLIVYDKQDLRCHDQASLAAAIAKLLSSASIGERLHSLVERPTAQDGGTSKS